MAKEKLTEQQIIDLLQRYNPKMFGADANPIVPEKVKFILTGKKPELDGAGNKVIRFVDVTKLSEEARKANPGLTPTRYLRITKVNDVKDITELGVGEAWTRERRPLADNLFERNDPGTFEALVRLLKEKNADGSYKHFTKLEDTADGLPRVKMSTPIWGAFITLQVPAHNRIGTDGKPLMVSRKDRATGTFGSREKAVFRNIQFFLYPDQFNNLQAIAVARFQNEVEPLLAEEVKLTLSAGGTIIKKDVTPGVGAEHESETVIETGNEGGTAQPSASALADMP